MEQMTRILLTGASGAVGMEVLKQLCELPEDVELTVFDIKSAAAANFYKKLNRDFDLIWGDISRKEDISKACAGKDVVIHLAAVIPPLADMDPALAEKINVTGTRNLVSCIEEQSPHAFLVYSSSISVYGDRVRDPWIKTGDRLIPSERDEYAKTKIEAEKIITGSKLRWTIFRLTAIMGVDNHKPSPLMFHMPLDTQLEISTPGDTGRAFVNSLHHLDVLDRKIFNLGGGDKCRVVYSEFLARSFRIFGLGALDFRKDTFAMKNFHCGFYEDGDLLNEILKFRKETLEDHFSNLERSVPRTRKIATMIFRKIIKYNLQRQSEPLKAIKSGNKSDIEHFFN
jgi:nucleoside-diphosphate-sugar epimerase